MTVAFHALRSKIKVLSAKTAAYPGSNPGRRIFPLYSDKLKKQKKNK